MCRPGEGCKKVVGVEDKAAKRIWFADGSWSVGGGCGCGNVSGLDDVKWRCNKAGAITSVRLDRDSQQRRGPDGVVQDYLWLFTQNLELAVVPR